MHRVVIVSIKFSAAFRTRNFGKFRFLIKCFRVFSFWIAAARQKFPVSAIFDHHSTAAFFTYLFTHFIWSCRVLFLVLFGLFGVFALRKSAASDKFSKTT